MREEIIQLLVSVAIGSILGLERELQSKAAGVRTLALICVGSTLFTLMSIRLGGENNADRIVANIVTGIGFLGAGVIFKNGYSVLGLTTAAAVWVAAAMGVAVGVKDYQLAWITLLITLTILEIFERLQSKITNFRLRRIYHIVSKDPQNDLKVFEVNMKSRKLKYNKLKEKRMRTGVAFDYEVVGTAYQLERFNQFLMASPEVLEFEY